ncbi:MAG: hypothetical protein JXP72_10310 [Coriobacteriia bacterium]|nr:hypothetical protein [Coriobacteriia bacterium]
MKRMVAVLGIALALALSLGGCSDAGEGDPATETDDGSSPVAEAPAGGVTQLVGLDPIATDGPGERAALAALPAALESARGMHVAGGGAWPDLAGAEPVLTAYVLVTELEDQSTLFEVRADGIVHSLYAYQRPFDSGTLVWTPTADGIGETAAPRSDAERAAAAAVQEAMSEAFGGQSFEVAVFGYRFSYIKDETLLLNITVGPSGDSRGVDALE